MLGRANAGREWLCGGYTMRASPLHRNQQWLAFFSARVTRDVWERKSAAMRSRVTRGHVTTFRPEHVVNRAGRTPVAVGPRQD